VVVKVLEAISSNEANRWDANSRIEESGLLSRLCSSTSIVSFQVAKFVFGFIRSLSTLLQGTTSLFLSFVKYEKKQK